MTVGSSGLRLCPPGDPTALVAAAASRAAGRWPGHGTTAASRAGGHADATGAHADDLAEAQRHVAAALPGDPVHEANRRRMLAFTADHPDALERTCQDGHLTGSAMVVDPASRRFLLMLHTELGRWFQPGGHADGDGVLPRVAWREATEETGIVGLRLAVPAIDLDIHEVGRPHGPHLHLDVRYLAVAPLGATPAGNHESLDLRWAGLDELPGYDVDPGMLRMARSALAALDVLDALAPGGIRRPSG